MALGRLSGALNTASATLLEQLEDSGEQWQIWQNSAYRWLQTARGIVHSAVNRSSPGLCLLPHIQAMSLAWTFIDSPKSVLLAGLGGGDQLRQLVALWPSINICCVELNPNVLRLYRRYFAEFTAASETFHCGAIEQHLQRHEQKYDCISIDILNGDSSPECLWRPEFYQLCQSRLQDKGVLVVNALPTTSEQLLQLAMSLRQQFCKRLLFIPVEDCDNVVLLMLNSSSDIKTKAELKLRLQKMQSQLGMQGSTDIDALIDTVYQQNIINAQGELDLWLR